MYICALWPQHDSFLNSWKDEDLKHQIDLDQIDIIEISLSTSVTSTPELLSHGEAGRPQIYLQAEQGDKVLGRQ